ncbi:hypothetical protein [Chitinophaga rhizosphaerae]|uniref:hypothetical protein n=1 Tax=Chitinophaga rhizosphaerae TaxID=1864947 RepID=UPI000F80FB73|nr:hypothetical protein [Chitinophaga rhizosphaerae]
MIIETQHMPPLARWIGGVIGAPLLVLFMYKAVTTGEWLEMGIASAVLLLGLGGMLMWLHMRLEADEQGIQLKIRPVLRLQRNFPWEELTDVTLLGAGRNFGGWGIRYVGDGWGYIFEGNQVLKLKLRNGKTRYITTNSAEDILRLFHRGQGKSAMK